MTPPDPEQLRAALSRVIDPKRGVNVVDLGLIYAIQVSEHRARVRLTMTSPVCPMGETILADVERELAASVAGGFEPGHP